MTSLPRVHHAPKGAHTAGHEELGNNIDVVISVSSELGELGVAGGLALELLVEVLGIVSTREDIQKGDRWHTLHRSLGYDRW